MTTISPELVAAVQRYGRPDVATAIARVATERQDMLDRFPVESWPELPLERYALGVGDNTTYCARMEFHTPYLGSIRGGSAMKHIIYRRNTGDWWIAGPLAELEPHQAWERLRAQFVEAIAAANDDPGDLDRFPLLRSGGALVTKTLALYAPEHFLRVNSGEHLRRFVRLLGASPLPDAPSWVLNRQFKQLVERAEPFAGWDQEEVLHFLYTYLDPRTGERPILKIAPGEGGRLWDDCLERHRIRVGFGEISDLRDVTTDDDLLAAVQAAYPDKAGSYQHKLTRQLMAYRDLAPGTRIVANRGTSEILAVGVVTDSGYRYDDTLPEYRHVVGVDWDTSYAQQLDSPARGWVSTFNNVPPELWTVIEQGRRGHLDPTPPPAVVPRQADDVLQALRRKGQVILFGPPGTGKTRLALTAALLLTGRTAAALSEATERAAAVTAILDDHDARVVLTSFHPSMGYEDFVEGYKPAPTGRGGLELALKDGLFLRFCDVARRSPDIEHVLVIDEINRADLARVLGELVTLLERDKREVVTARLAVSGRTFTVPRNIRIIGTMNTADRSVAHLDAAVRRRFAFLEVAPDSAVLEAVVGPLNLAGLLDELNDRLRRHLGRDHQLGHAYLLDDDLPVDSAEAVAAAFYHDLVPQIEDYALGDRDVLARVLGEQLVDASGHVIRLGPDDLLIKLAAEFGADASTVLA